MAQSVATFPSLGSYAVIRKLGSGGMAEVFLAQQRMAVGVERPVVIKSILPHLAEDETFVSMFLREARIASMLSHPNLVQIYDVSIIEGRPCIVMEFLRGRDLSLIIKRMKKQALPIAPEAAAAIAAQAATGLDHAHRRRDERGRRLDLVHRDVSPHNIFLTREGQARILDFGIAKSSYQQQKKTQGGSLKGKLAYMAPEQARGFDLDGRADEWSLGVVLWETLTGARLFARADPYHTMNEVFHGDIPPPSRHAPAVPPELDAIVLRMLERDPLRRFESCDEVARALRAFLATRGTAVEPELLADLIERAVPSSEDPSFYGFDAAGTGTAVRLPGSDETRVDSGTEITFAGPKQIAPPPASPAPVGSDAATALFSDAKGATAKPGWRLAATLVAIFALCAGVGIGVVLLVFPSDDPVPDATAAVVREVVAAPPADENATPSPTPIVIRLRNVPDGVRVELDGAAATTEIETIATAEPRLIRLIGRDGEVWRTEQVYRSDAVVVVPDLRSNARPRQRPRRPPAEGNEHSLDTNYP